MGPLGAAPVRQKQEKTADRAKCVRGRRRQHKHAPTQQQRRPRQYQVIPEQTCHTGKPSAANIRA
jgi:hypothetical protein